MALVRMLAFKPGGQVAVGRTMPLAPAAIKATVPLLAAKPAAAKPVVAAVPAMPVEVSAEVPAAPVMESTTPKGPSPALVEEFDESPPWDTADDLPVAQSKPVVPASAPASEFKPQPAYTQSANGNLPSAANWPQVSQEVPAKGLTRQALVQAELVDASREGDVLQIVLRTAIKAYTEPTMVTRLESVLGQYYESTVRLQMQFGEAQQTAHAVQSETRRQALEGAKQALQDDPFLKDIQNLMGATVVSGSERTLSNTGPADI